VFTTQLNFQWTLLLYFLKLFLVLSNSSSSSYCCLRWRWWWWVQLDFFSATLNTAVFRFRCKSEITELRWLRHSTNRLRKLRRCRCCGLCFFYRRLDFTWRSEIFTESLGSSFVVYFIWFERMVVDVIRVRSRSVNRRLAW